MNHPAAPTERPDGLTVPEPYRRLSTGLAAGLTAVLAAGLLLTGCGVPVADSQSVAGQPTEQMSASAATVKPKPTTPRTAGEASKLGADEFDKVTMNVTNNTNNDLWISSADLGHEGKTAAWDDRATNLVAGASETVSAYSAAGGQGIRLIYKSPDGSVRVTLKAQNPTIGKNNYDGTKATSPVTVDAKITDGLHSVATYVIRGTF